MKLLIQDLVTHNRGYILIDKDSARKLIRRAVAMWDLNVIPQEVRSDLEDYGKLEWFTDQSPNHLETIARKVKAKKRRIRGRKPQWGTKVPNSHLKSTTGQIDPN